MCTRRELLALIAVPLVVACTRRGEHGATDEAYPGLSSGYVDDGLRAEMRRVPVTMYMTTWCPHCRRAQQWLDRGGYSYVMLDVDADEAAADTLEAINPRGAVPTFDVAGRVVFGFEPRQLEHVIRRVAETRR